jgi:chemotaxis protein CheD
MSLPLPSPKNRQRPAPQASGPARGSYLELLPGDVVVGTLGDQFRTLLGSCISVVLTDPRRTVGAMCHIVHVGQPPTGATEDTAYGLPAMEAMFSGLARMGINPRMCEAFLYGGGNMFPELFRTQHVGANNADWVRAFLQQQGIAILDEHVGGHGYRKISWSVGAHRPEVEFIVSTQEGPHGD